MNTTGHEKGTWADRVGTTTHLGDVQQLTPEARSGQVKAAGHRDALPVGKDDIAALEEALLVLLVDEQVRLKSNERLGVLVARWLCRLLLRLCLRLRLLRAWLLLWARLLRRQL